jgi:hypothetical protein
VSMLAANAAVDGVIRGAWLVVADGLAAWLLAFFGEGYHPQARVGALVATDDGAATAADAAVDLCEGYRASGVAHCDNGEEQM